MSALIRLVVLTVCIGIIPASAVLAQGLSERIENHRQAREQRERQKQQQEQARLAMLNRRLNAILNEVRFGVDAPTTARDALTWWSRRTQVPLLINWTRMQQAGVDPGMAVQIDLEHVPAVAALSALLSQIGRDHRLIAELTPWYLRVMTREEALQHTYAKVYDISDLLVAVPNFEPSGSPGLGGGGTVTAGAEGGRSGAAGGASILGSTATTAGGNEFAEMSTAERAEYIARIIREHVEPDIWRAHGGQHASITVFRRGLIVRAPRFVHRQIGGELASPLKPGFSATRDGSEHPRGTNRATSKPATNVSGVQDHEPTPASGVHQ